MDKYQAVGVHAVIWKSSGKFLVVKRSATIGFMPNYWDLPGGMVELGEDPTVAVSREILEETNLKVNNLQPTFVYSELQKEIRHQIWIVYKGEYLGGDIKLCPEEHSEYKWVTPKDAEALPDKIIFLEAFLKNHSIVR